MVQPSSLRRPFELRVCENPLLKQITPLGILGDSFISKEDSIHEGKQVIKAAKQGIQIVEENCNLKLTPESSLI